MTAWFVFRRFSVMFGGFPVMSQVVDSFRTGGVLVAWYACLFGFVALVLDRCGVWLQYRLCSGGHLLFPLLIEKS